MRDLAGLPKVVRTGLVGTKVSDAYWKAKGAKQRLHALVDPAFREHASNWTWYAPWLQQHSDWITVQPYLESLNPVMYQRVARFAWWATWLTEKVATSDEALEMSTRYPGHAHDAIEGAKLELEGARIDRDEVASVERL